MTNDAAHSPSSREGGGADALSITYCVPCGYERRAREAAAELERTLGLTVELIAGAGGIFEVTLNGRVVAKRARGYFPSSGDIVTAVDTALQQPQG